MARKAKTAEPNVQGFTSGFGARLQTVISRVGTMDGAAAASGASVDQLTSWKFGRSRPDFFALSRLCDAAGLSITWLAKGSEGRDSSPALSQTVEGTQPEQAGGAVQHVDPAELNSHGLVIIPRLDVQASAGRGIVPQAETVLGFVAFQETYLRSIGVNPRFAHMLQISGDSMQPTLTDQDWVVVDTSVDRVIDEAIYALVYGDTVLAKRVQMLRGGGLILSSDNKAAGYIDEHIKPEDLPALRIVGRIRTRTHTL